MSPRSLVVYVAAAAVIATITVAMLQKRPTDARSTTPAIPRDIKGALTVITPVEYEVNAVRVRLCGVRFAKSAALTPVAVDVLRSRYEGRYVKCHPLGAGTPCDQGDYRSSPTMVIAQCMLDGATDFAAELVASGVLCGSSAQTTHTYQLCEGGQ